jgi:diketogulonate reductase-like aldo/keto reductase
MLSLGFNPFTDRVKTRVIPGSGEALPMVGLGTWQTFDVGHNPIVKSELKEVLNTLVRLGGSVIDSSPMYGRSESVIGELSSSLGLNDRIFGATKVWTQGRSQGMDQMRRSMERMSQRPMDLMQIHNLVDWKTHLQTLLDWKEKGTIRYVGITHYQTSAYERMAKIMKYYPLDFIQVNYSVGSPYAGDTLLPLAQDLGLGVIINRPYQGGSLFSQVRNKTLPPWTKEIECTSWAQFFLKFILSNPAVTCVIPGTSQQPHIKENLEVGMGLLPDDKKRRQMLNYFRNL